MNSRNLLAATALQTGALVLIASASPAFAGTTAAQPGSVTTTSAPPSQTPPTGTALSSTQTPVTTSTTPVELATNTDTSIVVTGSRIRRPNLESPVPITSVGGAGAASRGEAIARRRAERAASLRGTFSQSNSTTRIGTAGLSILDLRGLGTARTLVLVNGRRIVTVAAGQFHRRRQHDPGRPARARRHRHGRQFGGLRFGRRRRRRELHPSQGLSTASRFAPSTAPAPTTTAATSSSAPSPVTISSTAR